MTKKSKRSKKATKSSKQDKVTVKRAKETKVAPTSAPTTAPVTRSRSVRASIAEGRRLYALAGRPSKADFIKVYGPMGPKMTWAQRAEVGVDAKHFQATLAAKGGS